jgi:hypothetical protein
MTTLATQLQTYIERWAEELWRTNQVCALARRGELPARAVALYLESLRYLLHNSQRNLVLASAKAANMGDLALADYFSRKAGEEEGHERWALDDLDHLPDAVTSGLRPAPAIVSLVEYQRELIAQHPVCFVVYALWAEYFTVLLGDAWLDALAVCGFEREQISSIAKHLVADREHAADGFAEVDRLWHGQPAASELIDGIARAGKIFERFCDEVCGEAARAA